jgi:aminopeptidase-like protein
MNVSELDIIRHSWFFQKVHVSDDYLRSLEFIDKHFDLTYHRYPSGSKCGTWTLPPKWIVRKGRLSDSQGNTIVDVKEHPLYLWSYSAPFKGNVSREELLKHIETRSDFPEAIPWHFRQQWRFWEKNWGFSLPYTIVKELHDTTYYVEVDTEFETGELLVVEYGAPGTLDDIIVLCGHWCHPAMCNDGLSGCAVGLKVIDELRKKTTRYTYKMLIVPELIGAVAFLYHNRELARHIRGAININFVGSQTPYTFAHSMFNTSKLDRIFEHVFRKRKEKYQAGAFKEYGSAGDETAFEAPPYNLPCVCVCKEVPETYHTQFDNFNSIDETGLKNTTEIILEALGILEADWIPQNTFDTLPCLSAPEIDLYLNPPAHSNIPYNNDYYNLIKQYGEPPEDVDLYKFMTRGINLLDGSYSVFQIAEFFDLPFHFVSEYYERWVEKKLLTKSFCPTDNRSYCSPITIP